MAVILILLIASILVAGGFLVAFLISARNGQFDDQYGPPLRMLYEDEPTDRN
jgi:cbb3-type cytochrome oxidase maturation protein